jgi:hypothetical protein
MYVPRTTAVQLGVQVRYDAPYVMEKSATPDAEPWRNMNVWLGNQTDRRSRRGEGYQSEEVKYYFEGSGELGYES